MKFYSLDLAVVGPSVYVRVWGQKSGPQACLPPGSILQVVWRQLPLESSGGVGCIYFWATPEVDWTSVSGAVLRSLQIVKTEVSWIQLHLKKWTFIISFPLELRAKEEFSLDMSWNCDRSIYSNSFCGWKN